LNTKRFVWFLIVAATVLLTTLYVFWYWISPISDAFGAGRFLFIIYLLVALFWIIVRVKKSCLVTSLVMLLFVLNILYYKNFISSILDKVEHDRVHYYLTYSQEPIDGWQDYHITARKGLFGYNSYALGPVTAGNHLKLKYDLTISKMTVIETEWRFDREIIFRIDEENPLFYESFAELDHHVYYLFSSCRQMGLDCQNRIYFLYKCKFDNTYCEKLPFMYDGTYGGYPSKLISHETVSEIEVYIEPYFEEEQEFREVLIYSYGAEPRCYVEDCHNLETP